MSGTGLFVYVKPARKVGLIVTAFPVMQEGVGMNPVTREIGRGTQLVPMILVAFKDGWWCGAVGDTQPVWEETEMDSLGDGPAVPLDQFERDLAASAAAEGEQNGSEDNAEGPVSDGGAVGEGAGG